MLFSQRLTPMRISKSLNPLNPLNPVESFESLWILLNHLNPFESLWIVLNPLESFWIRWIPLNPFESAEPSFQAPIINPSIINPINQSINLMHWVNQFDSCMFWNPVGRCPTCSSAGDVQLWVEWRIQGEDVACTRRIGQDDQDQREARRGLPSLSKIDERVLDFERVEAFRCCHGLDDGKPESEQHL